MLPRSQQWSRRPGRGCRLIGGHQREYQFSVCNSRSEGGATDDAGRLVIAPDLGVVAAVGLDVLSAHLNANPGLDQAAGNLAGGFSETDKGEAQGCIGRHAGDSGSSRCGVNLEPAPAAE